MARYRNTFWPRVLAIVVLAGAVGYVGQHRVPAEPAGGRSFHYVAGERAVRPTLRIGTYNIAGGQRSSLDAIAGNLRSIDLVGLNEVHGSGFGKDQADQLGEKLAMPFLFAPTERRWWYDSFGNGVLCDLPVQAWRTFRLPSPGGNAPRNFVVARVRWGGRVIHVMVTHTDWKPDGVEQRRIVADVFLSLPSPAILMGDLNADAEDVSVARMLASRDVVDPFAGRAEGRIRRIDWVLLRGLEVVDAGIIDNAASDHPVVWVEVR